LSPMSDLHSRDATATSDASEAGQGEGAGVNGETDTVGQEPAGKARSRLTPTIQIFLGMLFAYLALGMVVPIMAPLVLALGLTELQGGLIFAVNYLLWVLASPFWGGQTEVWGRKPVILMGLIGFGVGHLFFGLVAELGMAVWPVNAAGLWTYAAFEAVLGGQPSLAGALSLLGAVGEWITGVFMGEETVSYGYIHWLGLMGLLSALIATRALAGGLFSGAPPASQAYIVDTVTAKQRTQAVGLLGAAAGIGTVAGPVVTLVTSVIDLPLTVPIYLAAGLPLVPAVVLWFMLPGRSSLVRRGVLEPGPDGQVQRPEKVQPPKLTFWDPRFRAVLLVGLMMNVAFALVLFTLGFYIQHRLDLTADQTVLKSSIAMLLVGIVAFFVQAVLLRALRWSPVTLMRVGLLIMAAGMLLLLFTAGQEVLIYLAVVVFGAGYSLTYPGFQTAITFTVDDHEQGAVAGMAAGAGAVAFIIGPVLGTWMYGLMWQSPYVLSGVVLGLTALFAFLSPRMKKLRRVSKGLTQ